MSDKNEQRQTTPFERALQRFQLEQQLHAQEQKELGGAVDHHAQFRALMWLAGRADLPAGFNPFPYLRG